MDYDKQFPVITICRADLEFADIPQTDIDTLSDADMEAIARRLKDALCAEWEDLQCITRLYLAEKQSRATGDTNETR